MTAGDKPPRTSPKRVLRDREFDTELGAKIRQLRVAGGVNQRTVGDALGVSFQQIQKYENGTDRVAVGTLNAIASFFGVTLAEFFSDTTPIVPRPQIKIFEAQRIGACVLAIGNAALIRRVMNLVDVLARERGSSGGAELDDPEQAD